MTHFENRSKTAKPVDDANNVRVWCGREVSPSRAVRNLTNVDCQTCRAAFARVLAALPNIDDEAGRWSAKPAHRAARAVVLNREQATLDRAVVLARMVNAIIDQLDGREWTADTCDEIAAILRANGYAIRQPLDAPNVTRRVK